LFALFFLVTYWSGKGGAKLKGMLVFSILPLACSSLMVGLLMMELPLWNGGGGDWLSESSWPMVWANFIRCMGVAALMTLLILRSVPQRYGYHLESLGYARTSQIWTVLLSWRAQALLSIFCLTFMLGMRDVPIALLLQPFDHSMLSAKMHQYFSEGEWQKASPQVMVVMMLSFPPLLWLSQSLIPKRTTC
jgi:ABC-type Fe3+ transport system permease subunit